MGFRAWSVAIVAALVGCSPYGTSGTFACTGDSECGPGGRCFAGFCAFGNGSCPSGYKYGNLSGPQANQCVMPDGGSGSDAPRDGHVDSPPGESCYGSGVVNVCFASPPTGAVNLPGDINTDDTAMCSSAASGGGTWCVIAGATISAPGTSKAHGSKPLVLIATQTISIAGMLDVASHIGGQVGAGADPSVGCTPGSAPGANGGGGGGSFGGKGGDGGDPNHGTAGATVVPTALRGGCKGSDGNAGGTIAVGGAGGGAVYLYAGTSITIAGSIDASGAGGTVGTPANAGGSGGGAGGYVVLESPSVTNNGVIYADGGGGSSGTGGTSAGSSGQDPNGTAAAAGGSGPTTHGGPGGAGSHAATLTGTNGTAGNSGGGGGGGGGGAGIIHVIPAQTLGGTVSPPTT